MKVRAATTEKDERREKNYGLAGILASERSERVRVSESATEMNERSERIEEVDSPGFATARGEAARTPPQGPNLHPKR